MKIVVCVDDDELSEKAARFVFNQLKQSLAEKFVLGLATGRTQVGFRQGFLELVKRDRLNLGKLFLVNLDEYWPLKKDSPQSYFQEMKKYFWEPLNDLDLGFDPRHAYIPNSEARNPGAEAVRYERFIRRLGGVNLQMLGIGVDGHIGFNERGSLSSSRTRVVELNDSTREANKDFFGGDKTKVPQRAITMGVATILEAKKILLLASGWSKKKVVKKLLASKPTSELPASFLKLHPDAAVMVDKEAYDLSPSINKSS